MRIKTACMTLAAASAFAQAQSWSNTLGTPGLTGSYATAFAAYDDGTGEALYVTGSFNADGVSGTQNLAKWNGTGWESVGGGLIDQYSNDLVVFQGDLIAGGYFNSAGGVAGTEKLARWDGAQWHSMDAQASFFANSVWDLHVWDDGTTGEQLYIAGNFVDLGGNGDIDHIAKWDGTSFSPVGPTSDAGAHTILALESGDLGSGEHLYAGGRFIELAGLTVDALAQWDGTQWTALGGGIGHTSIPQVLALKVWDDGNGPALYVGGSFTFAGAVSAWRVAKWDGTDWSAMGDGFDTGIVYDLQVFDDGTGEALYAFGNFTTSNGRATPYMAKWNGTQWDAVANGPDDRVFGAFEYDFGEGRALNLAGGFANINGSASARVGSYVAADSGCAADITGEGDVNTNDFFAFLALYQVGDQGADFFDDDLINTNDFFAYLAAYQAGC